VEFASPLFAASPEAAGVAPRVDVGWAEVEAGAVVEAGVELAPPRPPKRPPVAAPAAGAAEGAGVAELVPAAPNNEGAPLVAVVAAPLAAVVAAPLAGVADVGVPACSSFLKSDAGVEDAAAPNRLGVGAAEGVAALFLSPPPRLKPPSEGVAAGCDAAGWVAGVDPPRVNAGGLLAGVLDRPPPPNRPPAGLGVSCELAPVAGAAPEKSPGVEGAAPLFASAEPAAPPKRPVVGVEAPAGLAPNKLDVVPDAGAAGFEAALPPKRPPPVAPLGWLLFPPREKVDAGAGVCPNRPEPGGGPAGVVEGREKVLLGAGVAAGVEEPVTRCQHPWPWLMREDVPAVPNPNDGVGAADAAGAAPVEAPPNMDGFAASPVFAAEPKPKLGVDDAPAAAPLPKRPPAGLLAGVLDAPPPKRPEPPAAAPPPPNSPPPGVLDAGVAAPKRDGDAAPDVVPAPPNSPLAGLDAPLLALLPAEGCPKVKPDMTAREDVDGAERGPGCRMGVDGRTSLFTLAESCVRCAIGAVGWSRQRSPDGSERAEASECSDGSRNAVLGVFHRRVRVASKSWADSCMDHVIQFKLQRVQVSSAPIPRVPGTRRRQAIACTRARRSTAYYLLVTSDLLHPPFLSLQVPTLSYTAH
jgi:hypothetical protein